MSDKEIITYYQSVNALKYSNKKCVEQESHYLDKESMFADLIIIYCICRRKRITLGT